MSRFVYHPQAERILARQPGVVAALGAVTRRVETRAGQVARPHSSRFADGIDSDLGADGVGPFGRVRANWWGSLFVEFGTSTQPARAPLRQALDSARKTS